MSTAQRSGAPVLQSFAAADVSRALNTTSTLANGGALLSTELARAVWDKVREQDGPLARCLFLKTTKNQFDFPAFDETSRAVGSRWGGIRAYWEGGDGLPLSGYDSQPALANITFNPERCVVFSLLSNDLLEDAELAASALEYAAHQEIRYAVVDAMVNGNGIKRPLGVIKAPSTITVARAGANALAVADVDAMWSSLWPFCRRNAIWLCNDDTLLEIDAVAASGGWLSNVYLPQGMYGNPFPLLKGRPLIPCEQCPPLGQPGDLILGDWSQYALCARAIGGSPEINLGYTTLDSVVESRMLNQSHFLNDETLLVCKLRVDGKPMFRKPVLNANGSKSVGPFAILSA